MHFEVRLVNCCVTLFCNAPQIHKRELWPHGVRTLSRSMERPRVVYTRNEAR